MIRHIQRTRRTSADALAAHVRDLFLRLAEDYLFMARLRSQITLEKSPPLGLAPTLGSLGEHAPAIRTVVDRQVRAVASRSGHAAVL